jgi:predicted enzyme related to lactoylglutathione lyase
MSKGHHRSIGRVCWVDLAATDERSARRFYERLFGWRSSVTPVEHGSFRRFCLDGETGASVYQLGKHHLAHSVPSHWTPYISVCNAAESVSRAQSLGATAIVEPFDIPGIARIALLQDPIGALLGVWQADHDEP